jgi:hypothetical protein
VRRIVLVGVTVLALMAASGASSRPGYGTEDACACGGLKQLVASYPVGGGQWRCVYIVNQSALVYETHNGGCPG